MAKTFTFTKKRLDSLTNNGTARDVYHDAKIQGLQLRVSNSGRKTFISRPSLDGNCLLYTSPSPRDAHESRMPSSA